MGKDTSGRSGFWGAGGSDPRERAASEGGGATPTEQSSAAPADPVTPSSAAAADGPPPGPPTAGAATPPKSEPAGTQKVKRAKSRASRFELPVLVLIAVVLMIVLKTLVFQPFYIPSESMEQTLHGCTGCSGDRILVFKPVYRVRDPHPGDIVVFKAPVDWNEGGGVTLSSNPLVHGIQWFGQLVGVVPPSEKDLVKRVIAVGGQTIKCCDSNGNVQVSDTGANGPWRSLNEPYIYQPSSWSPSSTAGVKAPDDTRSFGPVTVPAGRLWVMGDHRSDSADSRYHCGAAGVGDKCDPQASTVGVRDVIGKAVVIAWPPSRWRTLGTPKTFAALGLPGVGSVVTEPVPALLLGVGSIGLARRRRRRRR